MNINQHKKQFGNQAEDYTKYRKPYVSELYDFLFSLITKSKSVKVLDIACGTGKSTEPLVRDGFEVFGVDHDELMIAEAKKQSTLEKLDINYYVADVENLPFTDESFDVVTIGTAFHWFVNEKAMQEIKRVLKPNGLLFIFWTLTTKNIPEEDSIPAEIFRSFNWEKVPVELRDLNYISSFLTNTGFKDVSTTSISFTHQDSVEDQVGSLKTASSFSLLSAQDKEDFLEQVTVALTKKLGDRPYFIYEEDLQICYGFK